MSAYPRITPADRLRATLTFSLLVHAMLVFGIGFAVDDPAPLIPTLDVILAETRSPTPPDEADFLAASSQQGGGETDRPERPSEPTSADLPKPTPGVAAVEQPQGAPTPVEATRQPVLTARSDATELALERRERPDLPLPDRRELIERSLEMARLAAEIERQSRAYAKRPKRKFISANTREYEYANYMRAWVARVERIGNLNYPEEARRRNVHGQLVMTVAVRRDGTVERIDIIQPSGYPVLDDAAIRTVRLAEPFPPLPESKEPVDILHITRTWQFLPGGVLRNR
ncbi:MAG: cell envelope biogenesis protein TonB [Lysobacteraceae bacterium]|nr:MAG: cell envelope biogenesis protein TonB [Xanthomonadaceae bacterium]